MKDKVHHPVKTIKKNIQSNRRDNESLVEEIKPEPTPEVEHIKVVEKRKGFAHRKTPLPYH